MRVLFVGDIFGRPGRAAVAAHVPRLRAERAVDLVIANCENLAGGLGATQAKAEEMFGAGLDVATSGNHVWAKKEFRTYLARPEAPFLRPANYPPATPGKGYLLFPTGEGRPLVAVVNLLGRVFMQAIDCPFTTGLRLVEQLSQETSVVIVDFHAEATSEKQAMGRFLDGKVSAVIGTHTHVQTADEQILPGGTAYITDAGMTGPVDSVIGAPIHDIVEHFLTGIPARIEPAKGRAKLEGVLIEIDEHTGHALSLERIRVGA